MALTSIEIMALIVASVSLIKVAFILFDRKSWMKIVKPIYGSNKLVPWIFGILALITLYFLLDRGINIVQIFAVSLFVILIFWMSLSIYGKEILTLGQKIMKSSFPTVIWAFIIIWVLLSLWVFYTLIFS